MPSLKLSNPFQRKLDCPSLDIPQGGPSQGQITPVTAMWAAEGEAAVRTVVDTARLTGNSVFGTILKTIGA